MLGALIGEGKGKRSARRVVATEPLFKVEVSFEDVGTLYGTPGMNIGTYVSNPKPDGSLHGYGRAFSRRSKAKPSPGKVSASAALWREERSAMPVS